VIDKLEFTEGLTFLGLSLRQVYSPAEQGAFYEILRARTDAAEWKAFTRTAAAGQRWTAYLPTLPDLLSALQEFRGAPPLDGEAITAYERVLSAGRYTAEGTTWSFREVLERCGRASAEAFLEAGGHNAFASTWRESDRRERFVAAYVAAARSEPAARLLPCGPGEAKAITAGDPQLTRDEAVEVLGRLSGIHAAERDEEGGGLEGTRRLTQREWDARVEALRSQATEITTEKLEA